MVATIAAVDAKFNAQSVGLGFVSTIFFTFLLQIGCRDDNTLIVIPSKVPSPKVEFVTMCFPICYFSSSAQIVGA
jgi:hypothetical protein